MPSLLVTGIGELVTNDPQAGPGPLGVLRDAALVAEDGQVTWIGPASAAPAADAVLDAAGRAAVPGFVDSHTHLVFAGDRAAEFEARMVGAPTPPAASARLSLRRVLPATSSSRAGAAPARGRDARGRAPRRSR